MNIRPREGVPLSPHTVFKVGGTARYFFEADSQGAVIEVVRWARHYKLPFFVLGAGSNVLALDRGFPGVVIKPTHRHISVIGNAIIADAGAMMPAVSAMVHREGLAGFEWAAGIPGTIGGSVRGNAGCFGRSMADCIESVVAFDAILGREKKFSNADALFGYRDSVFKKHPEYVILSATVSLSVGRRDDIRKVTTDYLAHRAREQAVGEKCAGCVFKNAPWEQLSFRARQKLLMKMPELARFKNETHIPAGFVLDQLGLKGYSIGKAAVSKKHANFFINEGGATAHEIAALISHCKEFVHRKTGLLLEEEIRYI